jgi:hypothetical protein
MQSLILGNLLPGQHMVKINWDASIHKVSASIGFGCVAQDHLGNFLGTKVSYHRTVVDPKMAETMSAHHAVLFAKEVGFTNVIFEGMPYKLSKLYAQLLLTYTILDILLRAYIKNWSLSNLLLLLIVIATQMRWLILLHKKLYPTF